MDAVQQHRDMELSKQGVTIEFENFPLCTIFFIKPNCKVRENYFDFMAQL